MPQKGGSYSATSVNNNKEVNHLISMLTSESNNFSINSTSTEQLENKLRKMLQNGSTE